MDHHLSEPLPQPLPSPREVWERYDAAERRLSTPLTERMLDLAGLQPGMKLLDLATGRGEPAIPAARRVAPEGEVWGVDLSADMLAMAAQRARREDVHNLQLRVTSAETLEGVPAGAFQVVLARWCLMYFADAVAALRAARRSLIPGGLLVAAVWGEPERVDYHTLPRELFRKHGERPADDLLAPGACCYADQARLQHDLTTAGFSVEAVEELYVPVMEARTAEELIAWTRAFGMTRLLNALPASAQQAWERDMVAAGEKLRDADGWIRLGGVTRIVVARATAAHSAERGP